MMVRDFYCPDQDICEGRRERECLACPMLTKSQKEDTNPVTAKVEQKIETNEVEPVSTMPEQFRQHLMSRFTAAH